MAQNSTKSAKGISVESTMTSLERERVGIWMPDITEGNTSQVTTASLSSVSLFFVNPFLSKAGRAMRGEVKS